MQIVWNESARGVAFDLICIGCSDWPMLSNASRLLLFDKDKENTFLILCPL